MKPLGQHIGIHKYTPSRNLGSDFWPRLPMAHFCSGHAYIYFVVVVVRQIFYHFIIDLACSWSGRASLSWVFSSY